MTIVWVLGVWLASSVVFGALWALTAASLKAARRAPGFGVDLAATRGSARRVRYRAPRAHGLSGGSLARASIARAS